MTKVRVVHEFPRRVDVREQVWIPLADGTRLAARIWLPDDARPTPCRPSSSTSPTASTTARRAATTSRWRWFAGHGYAGVRVDLRGTGESDGRLRSTSTPPQEQEDALEVIAWLAAQPWCTGAVGMIGYSWSGFNALQVAARRPPALKAIVTALASDDRYADDVHYRGGLVLPMDMVHWATCDARAQRHPAGPGGGRRRLARALAGPPRRDAAVHRGVARPTSAATRTGSRARSATTTAPSRARSMAIAGWTDGYTDAPCACWRRSTCRAGADRARGATSTRCTATRDPASAS